MEKWSKGIYLLGRYNNLYTGCWLLAHGRSGAILELPPYNKNQSSPARTAYQAARKLGVQIKYLFCTHAHGDHFSLQTLREFIKLFPNATIYLQSGFYPFLIYQIPTARYFDGHLKLFLDGEVLYLVHAPKHSWTDTMLIFRGAIITGDWQLNTIHDVHDGRPHGIPTHQKLRSIEKMIRFPRANNYHIHKVFSVHANDRRENVDFVGLMREAKVARCEELLILVLDGSGSMSHDDAGGMKRAKAVEQAVKELMEAINQSAVAEEQFVAIIGYDHRSEEILVPTCIVDLRVEDPEKILDPVELPPLNLLSRFGGSTAIGTALRHAQEIAEDWLKDEKTSIQRYITIFLITDGYEEEGTEPEQVAQQLNDKYKAPKGILNCPEIVLGTVAYGQDPPLQQYHETLNNMATQLRWRTEPCFFVEPNGKRLYRLIRNKHEILLR